MKAANTGTNNPNAGLLSQWTLNMDYWDRFPDDINNKINFFMNYSGR